MHLKSIIEDMKQLGFSEYEIKAYLSLLEGYPVNGYVLSKSSGVPRSRIYEVLSSLEDKRIVFREVKDDGNIYYPLEPELLIEKLRKDMTKILSHVEKYTHELYAAKKEDQRMIAITGYDEIIAFVELLIEKAKKRIAVSIWETEADLLSKALLEAKGRGVSIKGIYFGRNAPVEGLVYHRRIKRYLVEKKERHINIIIDGEQVVSGVISRGTESRVSWIKDSGFVEMSEDFISHDVMINAYSSKISGEEKAAFERFSDESRRDYFEYSKEAFDSWKYNES